ncbi:unnamed protein product [Echinostoma caproni]|uniref:3-oxosteroid 1-dehydrogenase n=1 Tax=Echinostoma caproni TaxID=27848 RepID=A0A183ANN4_9TREM|nr:unnamed protein product [Echinostoma caproni]
MLENRHTKPAAKLGKRYGKIMQNELARAAQDINGVPNPADVSPDTRWSHIKAGQLLVTDRCVWFWPGEGLGSTPAMGNLAPTMAFGCGFIHRFDYMRRHSGPDWGTHPCLTYKVF